MAAAGLNLATCLKRWTNELASTSDSARLDVEILFRHISGWSETQLLLRDREILDESLIASVDAIIRQRAQGRPVAHLVGQREFYSLPLKITAGVLIPRPETEMLVDLALSFIQSAPTARVLDLGTGSGAIALAIAANAPSSQVLATDRNPDSLALARDNARTLGLSNVSFLLSDWFGQLAGQSFDLIVANPPYIDPADPHLAQGDVRFEPRSALVARERGLGDLRQIISVAQDYLASGGWLALEHGYDQGEAVRRLMQDAGLADIQTHRDLNHQERITTGKSQQAA